MSHGCLALRHPYDVKEGGALIRQLVSASHQYRALFDNFIWRVCSPRPVELSKPRMSYVKCCICTCARRWSRNDHFSTVSRDLRDAAICHDFCTHHNLRRVSQACGTDKGHRIWFLIINVERWTAEDGSCRAVLYCCNALHLAIWQLIKQKCEQF